MKEKIKILVGRQLYESEESVRRTDDGVSHGLQISDQNLVFSLQKCHATREACIGLGCRVPGMSHDGAQKMRFIVDKDLESIHVVLIQVVHLLSN